MRCECGCGEEAKPGKRFLHGHHARLQRLDFDKRYVVDEESGCHVWIGLKNAAGYGRFGDHLAHRIAYEREHGPIPIHLQPDHLCRNPACVNPRHLELVTPAENTRRGRKTTLTREQVAVIRESTEAQTELARRFGVAPCTISNIRARRSWRDV